MSITPKSRPNIDREKASKYLDLADRMFAPISRKVPLILGIRGYYLDTMGTPGVNERGEYDDAAVIWSPNCCEAFNFNTDPSRSRPGMAVLKPGVWRYQPGTHGLSKPKAQQYAAFVQAGVVTVKRDGQGDDTGWFGINIHRGGDSGTSSLGCQTVPPSQWTEFRETVMRELARKTMSEFRYVLVEEKAFRAGGNA